HNCFSSSSATSRPRKWLRGLKLAAGTSGELGDLAPRPKVWKTMISSPLSLPAHLEPFATADSFQPLTDELLDPVQARSVGRFYAQPQRIGGGLDDATGIMECGDTPVLGALDDLQLGWRVSAAVRGTVDVAVVLHSAGVPAQLRQVPGCAVGRYHSL